MSEPVLRRSGRNAAKKDAPAPPTPASTTKKRSSAEPKKPTAKKVKTAVDKSATPVKAAVTKPTDGPSSSKTAAATEKAEKTEKLAKPTAKPTAAKPPAIKPAAKSTKPAKVKKADESSEGLKDGDFIPKDLPEIQTEDGTKTTITSLLETAQKGIIIFAYPKAQTQGCISQACLFRDSFTAFSDAGYTVYGLSGDSPASNEKFKTKYSLTYTLLCDPTFELHEKFAVKKKPKGTIRSVIIIEKTAQDDHAGKILRSSPASPQISLDIAKEAVGIDQASIIAAASEAKEAEKKASNNETTLAVGTATVDAAT